VEDFSWDFMPTVDCSKQRLLHFGLCGQLTPRVRTIVAVVDGECRMLKSLGDLLASAGYDARLFSSAEEFLADPGIRATACLICGVSGIDLMFRIKAEGMELPCILLTDRAEPDTVLFCRTGGAKFFFPKLIPGRELLAAVALATNRLGVSRRTGFADSLAGRAVSRLRTFLGWQVFVHAYAALFRSAAGANRPT
jgi:FixJ family two-component response regulator